MNIRSITHNPQSYNVYIGEMGVSWHMGFVGTLSFSLSANYDFTTEYHLYKGTNNTNVYTISFPILLDQHCWNKSTLFDFSPSE